MCSGGDRPAARFVSSASGAQRGSVTLTFDAGREITLPQAISADGGRYAGNGVEFWIKGRSATLTRNGVSETCSAQ
ncbi:MliC family protein [Rhodoblastus sp. 17X3]|uniref:MliC family protein n=1 Tax=Rhodoblastus sp. 17X3 TaxID=3047026 RepID=UPI0024B719D3|nr:MliC family protein [Rhodoblastus sp. 17X3]MDI9849840.1 MliC family protein [Rhodoblastus sp. 17X3]